MSTRCLALLTSMEARAVKICQVLDTLGIETLAAIEKWHSDTWSSQLAGLSNVAVAQVSNQRLPAHLLVNPVRSRAIRRLNFASPDIVFARDIFLGAVAVRMRQQQLTEGKRTAPVVVDVADDLTAVLEATSSKAKRLYRQIVNPRSVERQALAGAQYLFFVTDAAIAHYEDRHGLELRSKSFVVPNSPMGPISSARPTPVGDRSGDLLYVGTIDRNIRDFEVVLASDQYLDRSITLDCYTFKPDQNAYVKELRARAQGLKRLRLRFLEAVRHEDYASVLDRYKVGVIPHHRSEITDFTVPNKLYDYIDRGLRIVASDNPAVVAEMSRLGHGNTYVGEDAESFARVASLACSGDPAAIATPQKWPLDQSFYFGQAFTVAWRRLEAELPTRTIAPISG